jgi:hypothetical protein
MKTYNEGLRDAASLLLEAAKDYEKQTVKLELELNVNRPVSRPMSTQHRLLAITHEKSVLLRGQAANILNLQNLQ